MDYITVSRSLAMGLLLAALAVVQVVLPKRVFWFAALLASLPFWLPPLVVKLRFWIFTAINGELCVCVWSSFQEV